MPKIVGVAWAEHSNRLDWILASLGGKSFKISLLSGKKFLAPFRYLYLGVRTLHLLYREGAEVVIAQNPPIFCALFSYFYVKLHGGKLIVDNHSLSCDRLHKSVLWKFLSWVERATLRRALVNTVIHQGYARKLGELGISCITLYDSPPEFPVNDPPIRSGFEILCPLGGHPDEDVDLLLRLSSAVEDAHITITGKLTKPAHRHNVRYAGFLPREEYLKRLRNAKMGLCLIRDNEMTLPYVLFEFASAELPFLVTRTATTRILDDCFLISDFEELARKVNSLKDKDNYAAAVAKTRVLKETFIAKSKQGIESLSRVIKAQD